MPRRGRSCSEESAAERWSRLAKERQRRNAVRLPDDDVGIDFSSMPQFETFEEGNAWLLEQLCEQYVHERGHWELFENSQRVPGFEEAKASWKRASGEFLRLEGYRDVISGPFNPDAMFFCRVGRDPVGALVDFQPIILAAAQRGDVKFFLRIASEIKRVGSRKRHSTPVLHMLNYWLHGFLWLMPSTWGSHYLESITGEPISQESYEKYRQRLKLIGWEAELPHPPIEGYNPKTGLFTFRRGWTNLNPDLSR